MTQLYFGNITKEELDLAREIATEVCQKYGDFDDASYHQFMNHGIWNDHVSVQTAIATIKRMKPR